MKAQYVEILKKNVYFPLYQYFTSYKPWIQSYRGKITTFFLGLMTIIPLALNSAYYYHVFIMAMIYSIYAASWDVLSGVTGQVSFGHAIFLGIGGYTCGAAMTTFELPWGFATLLGGCAGVLFGLLIGIPCLKLKGPYLALGTLVMGLIFYNLFNMGSLEPWLGGTGGIRHVPPISWDGTVEFVSILIIMILCIIACLFIMNSNLGTIFKAIRDNETTAEASGINTTKYKLIAFSTSAFFTGIAGALFCLHSHAINPAIFSIIFSFYAIIMSSIGGLGTVSGGVFGAYFFVLVNDLALSEFEYVSLLIFAIILILVLKFTERGLLEPAVRRSRQFLDILLGK